jgi:subfamily B ATP-binding cassette protein MsbA
MKIFSDITKFLTFLKKTDVRLTYVGISVLFSLIAAMFEGISMGCLIPLARGIAMKDFSSVMNLQIFKIVANTFPKIFLMPNTSIFVMLVGIVFIAAVLKNTLQYLASLCMARFINKFSGSLRNLVFSRYLSFGKMFFDHNNIGHLQNILVNFTALITRNMADFQNILNHTAVLCVYLIIMFIISWQLTVFTIIIFPVLNYTLGWLIKRIRKTSGFFATAYSKLSYKISDTLLCIPLVKLYSNEDAEKAHFKSLSDHLGHLEFSIDKKKGLVEPLQETIMLVAVLLLTSAMAFLIVKEKTNDMASFLVYLVLLKKASSCFGTLNNFKLTLATISGPMSAISQMLDDKGKIFVSDGAKEFSSLEKSVDFNCLNFSYSEKNEVLRNITFSVEKGKTTAIVGSTGAGKTTIINLILRFYDPPPASIYIDGVDIRNFTLKSLRSHMALVSQDTLLFNDTIKNNIIYGLKRMISDEEIIDVAKRARLYDLIISLPEKFDTYVGDRGVRLSGGEKQRVSIARALLKGAEMLILDEATSSLDSSTEKLIQDALNEVMEERTAIVIAHRLFTIRHADKIVVIENGSLIEQGSLNELLEKKGKFYEYWEAQKFY